MDRQREAIQRWCDYQGHTIVGWSEDVDVSGDVEPWKRPSLSAWLPDNIGQERPVKGPSRASEVDVYVAWKYDRVSRRIVHLHQLLDWAHKNGKEIKATAEDVDFSTPMGRVFLSFIASMAEAELETIRIRSKASFAHLAKVGRYRGGPVPFGYTAEPLPDGGYRLVIDPVTGPIVRRIVDDLLGGGTLHSVVRWLNGEGVLTPRGSVWRPSVLSRLISGRTWLGQMMVGHKGGKPNVARDDSGKPVQRAEPLITLDEWSRIKAALKANSAPRTGTVNHSPLLGVAYCECGSALSVSLSRNKKYVRCTSKANTGQACGTGKMIPVTELQEAIYSTFIAVMGSFPITERVLIPGVNNDAEIADVHASMERLQADRLAGMYDGAENMYRESFKALSATLAELDAQPATTDRYETRQLGVTYAEHWDTLHTDQERAEELRRAGVRVVTTKGDPLGYEPSFQPPPDGQDRTLYAIKIHDHAILFLPQQRVLDTLTLPA